MCGLFKIYLNMSPYTNRMQAHTHTHTHKHLLKHRDIEKERNKDKEERLKYVSAHAKSSSW